MSGSMVGSPVERSVSSPVGSPGSNPSIPGGAACDKTQAIETQLWLKGDADPAGDGGNGVITDYSSRALHATRGAALSYAAMTTRSGWFTSVVAAGSDGGAEHPVDSMQYDYVAGESLILGFWMNVPDIGSALALMGQAANTTRRGFKLYRSGSGVHMSLYSTAGQHNSSPGVVTEIDGLDHHVVMAVDGDTGLAYKWLDGNPNGTDLIFSGLPATGDTLPNNRSFNFGNSDSGSSDITQYKDFRALILPAGGLPMNMQAIVDKMMNFPECPITPDDLNA